MNILDRIPTLTEDDKKVIRLLEHQENDWTKKCFEAALIHLEFAHQIAELDPAMAMFRSITAEEEAATALFRSLQKLKYPRADELQSKFHLHKAAAFPFILSVIKHSTSIKFGGVENIKMGIPKNESPPRLTIALVLTGQLQGAYAHPNPPLNLKLTEGNDNQPPDYRRYLVELLDADSLKDIRKYFEQKANQRNILLYAGPQGLMKPLQDIQEYLAQQKNCVVVLLKSTLLIWPYKELQPFVADLIEAFLLAVQRVQSEVNRVDP